jgi:hypothetical protein
MISRGTAHRRRRGWQEGRDPVPPVIGEGQGERVQHLDRPTRCVRGQAPVSPRRVTLPSPRLMVSAEVGPSETERDLFGWLREHAEQAPHLRDGERDQVVCPPFAGSTA